MQTHTKLAKTIHWTFSILYAYGILKQVEDLDELEDPSLLNFEIFFAVIFMCDLLLPALDLVVFLLGTAIIN